MNKEAQQKKTPYWRKAILEAMRSGHFTDAQANKAEDWTTCACGEQDPRIPRLFESRAPEDSKLRRLGSVFSVAVREDEVETAAELLDQIEERAAIVLRTALATFAIDPAPTVAV